MLTNRQLRSPSAAVLCVLCVLLLGGAFTQSSCGLFTRAEKTPLPTEPYQPLPGALDAEYFHSPLGDIAGRYPKGWLHVNMSTIPFENVLAVYTDPDRSRALVLAELPGTAEFRRNVERDGMLALADQSFANKSARRPGKLTIVHPTDIFTIGPKLFASYEYAEQTADTLHRAVNRIAVFTTGAKFYELGLIELEPPASPEAHTENFRLLESVIGSLEGVAQVRGLIEDNTGAAF